MSGWRKVHPGCPGWWECGYPCQGCSSWAVSRGCVGKLKGNEMSEGGREQSQAGEALRLLRSSSERRGWCEETRVRLRIINVRRGSAPLGHLLESFDCGQNFANLNCWAFRRTGSPSSPVQGYLVPLPWVKHWVPLPLLLRDRVSELNKSSLPMWVVEGHPQGNK